jgi:3-dehydroquinate synthase
VFADGIAETLKYGIIGDVDLFEKTATGNCRENLEEIIETCVKMKRDIVMEDEFDNGVRQLLNLGHTLGHAIEKRSGFTISHGHAVAIGMHLIGKAAEEKGMAETGLSEKIRIALEKNQLPVSIDYSAEEIVAGVLKDKKRRGGEISFVFPTKIGHCEIVKIPVEEVTELVEKALK